MVEELVIKIRSGMEEWSKEDKPKCSRSCIYRVPKIIRDLNPDAYTPSVVSFGPYHHCQNDELKRMEPYKAQAVCRFFHRNSGVSFKEVVEAMMEHVSEMMGAYDNLENIWTYDEERFVELMLFDACFLVEILTLLYNLDSENYYGKNDPVFSSYVLSSFRRDILKLENQLPLQALSILMKLPDKEVANYFQKCFLFEDLPSQNISACHILDLQRQLRGYAGNYWYYRDEPNMMTITELRQYGVHFKKSDTRSFMDITFKDGVLSIPTMQFQYSTEAWFLNIIVFEQLYHPRHLCGIHSYFLLMHSLVKTAKDVHVLREKGIITTFYGDDKEIVRICNRLARRFELLYYGVEEDMDYKLNRNITDYCKRRWNRWRARFLHTDVANPWIFFLPLFAFILLVLAILKTRYTLLSYYNS